MFPVNGLGSVGSERIGGCQVQALIQATEMTTGRPKWCRCHERSDTEVFMILNDRP